MDFLKDIEDYHAAMDNAYAFITKRITMDTVYEDLDNKSITEFYLPFDPISSDGRDEATLDLLIEHFTELEEYEKCQELLRIKSL
tara:strand:+ start:3386 stop:3640 length:255 start_codon:yes stop_codon:yes gene_type:complete